MFRSSSASLTIWSSKRMGMIPISQTGRNHRFLKMTNLWKFSVQVGNQIGVAEYYLQSRLICPHRCLLSGAPPACRFVLLRLLSQLVLYSIWTQFFWKIPWVQFLLYSISRWCPPFCYTISSPNCNGVSSRTMNNSQGTSLHSTESQLSYFDHISNIDV